MKEIKVYSKDNKTTPIAHFDNSSVYKSENTMINVMAEPTLHVELGKLATLTFKMMAKSEKWKQINHIENEFHAEGRVFSLLEENSVSIEGQLVDATAYEIGNLLKKDYCQIHNVDTSVEAMDDHTVKILPRTDDRYKLTVNGTEYNDSDVVDSRGVVLPRGSAGYCLWALIKANKRGWKLGVVDLIDDNFNVETDTGTFNLESDMKSILENIEYVVELWGGVLIWDSKNKIVHLRDETKVGSDFNAFKGFSVYKGKNLLEDPQIQVDNNIITRAYLLGNGNIHVEDVNDGKRYIDNFGFTSEIYEGYLKNDNIHYTGANSKSGQTQLLEWGKRKLEEMSKPRYVYLFSILDRKSDERFSHETYSIGDMIQIHFTNDLTGKDEVHERRIIDIKYDIFADSEVSVMAGDKILNKVDIFELVYDNSVGVPNKQDWSNRFNADDIVFYLDDLMAEYLGSGFELSFPEYVEKITDKTKSNTQAVGDLRTYSDNTFTTQELFTEFEKQTEDEFIKSNSRISLVSDELHSQIQLEANHYKETTDSIAQSNARITVNANNHSAFVELEARHYAELKGDIQDTSEAVAGLRVYADGKFATISSFTSFKRETEDAISHSETEIEQISDDLSAQIKLEASHWNQLKQDIDDIWWSKAQFEAYADDTYARVSMLAQTNNTLASVVGTANAAYSEVRVVAERTDGIDTSGGYLRVSSGSAQMGSSGTGNYVYVGQNYVSIWGDTVSINGDDTIDLNGYVYVDRLYIGGRRIRIDPDDWLYAD